MFRKDAKVLEKLIEKTFIMDFKRQDPIINVDFYFGYADDLYKMGWNGTRQIGVIRTDYQEGGWISSFYTLKQYFKMNTELNEKHCFDMS